MQKYHVNSQSGFNQILSPYGGIYPIGGRSFLNQFSGASAGYSLRQLSSFGTDVVRVRRSSDDAEQDFSANEVKGSGLLDFVLTENVRAKFNNAMFFDSGDAVEIPASTNFWNGGNTISLSSARASTTTGNRLFERDSVDGVGQSFRALLDTVPVNGQVKVIFRHKFSTSGDAIWETTNPCFNINDTNTISITYNSSSVSNDPVIVVNGVTQAITETTTPVGTADSGQDAIHIGNTENNTQNFNGIIYDVTIGTSFYNGDGSANSNWEDQVGSNDGTVIGSPVDFTGQGYNGYVSTWYDQRVPTSKDRMYFDGVDDKVTFTGYKGITGTQERSLYFEFSTTVNTSNPNDNNIFDYGATTASSGNLIVVNVEQGKIALRVFDGFVIFGDGSLNDGELHRAILVFPTTPNTNNVKCFVDGVELSVDSVLAQTIDTGSDIDLTLGKYSLGAFFNGIIQNIRFYDSDLSDVDSENLTNGNSITPTPVFSVNGYGTTDADWTDQVGSNDGTVNGSPARTLDDLSVISKDAIQETTANQPLIVENGVLVTDNGKPAISFDGTNDYLTTPTYIVELSANDAQVSAVVNSDGNPTNTKYILTEGDVVSPYSSNFILGGPSGDSGILWVNSNLFGTLTADQIVLGFEKTGGAGTGSKTFQAYLNGATSGASGSATVNAEVFNRTIIGASADNGGAGFFDGRIQELVCYKNTTNSIVEIQNNQKQYYGI